MCLAKYFKLNKMFFEVLGKVIFTLLSVKFSFSFIQFVYNIIYESNVDFKSTGKWAGCTDGIGKAYAEQLAKKGIDIVLISRTKSKLECTAKMIRDNYNVQTKIIVADFTEDESSLYPRLSKELDGMDIGILINNAGQCYSHPEYFLNFKDDDPTFKNIIRCNIISIVNMCRIVMPAMVKKRRGIIMNIGSLSSPCPSPLLTVYGSSKTFVQKFSEDLNTEYQNYGVLVQCVMPGFVVTKMSKINKPTWLIPTAERYVESALKTTKIEKLTTGYFPHTLLIYFIILLKTISPSLASTIILNSMQKYRNKGLNETMKNN
ncbi:very-long-chain 3-oxoacyl-CoA reductase-B-like isoform X2 [Daktulosphaira vitifoliae]|uniref:very-long-chain 3-oxoacyl-CoA reductase-B-like isoform X2 n=1 Tax=Daktulosphaira vitifoliae TaxID=58002 RepID=UPI0021A9913E|nr:very-long-chain 3-oxoacyl-CoA reductase-B-like isoform X2 [Daktulosphaira vitifoliae]